MARSEYDVVQPPTREEALDAVADAIRYCTPVKFTLLGRHEVPVPKEFDISFMINRISHFEEGVPTVQGKIESGKTVFVEIGSEAIRASIVTGTRSRDIASADA